MDPIAGSYDAVAQKYAEEIGDELDRKPVDRLWLDCLIELCDGGVIADVGCGPGHVTAYLADRGAKAIGLDLSPGMIRVASARYPSSEFVVGSLLDLRVPEGSWAGAVCQYSIIHLEPSERPVAFAELKRALVPGGWLLLSFHIGNETEHLEQWWGERVDLDFHYLRPEEVAAELGAAGFKVMAVTQREPWPGAEHPSRRCHLLAQADG